MECTCDNESGCEESTKQEELPEVKSTSLIERYLNAGADMAVLSDNIEKLFKERTEANHALGGLLGELLESEGFLENTTWIYQNLDNEDFIFVADGDLTLRDLILSPYGNIRPTRIQHDILRTEDNDMAILSLVVVNGGSLFMSIDSNNYKRAIQHYHLSSIDTTSILARTKVLSAEAAVLLDMVAAIDREAIGQ